jgi:hypothetical protein
MNSCTPSSCSRLEIAVEMDGWDMFTRSDARVMLPVSAVAMKYSSCLNVKRIMH